MKTMKNIKPAYAVKLGKGVFAGGVLFKYACNKCGRQTTWKMSFPGPTEYGRCPEAKSGNHVWKKVAQK